MIFLVIQNAGDQKTEMEKIKGKMAQEVSKIEERKAKIDHELKEVQVSLTCAVSMTLFLKINIHTTALYVLYTCHPSCTYPFFTSVSLPLFTIAAL